MYSSEIIPEVARTAKSCIEQRRIKNVSIHEGDGGEGYAYGAPYDRAIFTAGTYDLPHHFFEQMKNGSLLLTVIKNEGGGDNLFLLRRTDDHFESLESMTCSFVQMTGRYRVTDLDPIPLNALSEWTELKANKVANRKYWWGFKSGPEMKTLGIRSFLGITEPFFQTFKTENTGEYSREVQYFGLWDKKNHSLVIAKDDMLTSYGSLAAERRLMEDIKSWVDLGMPHAASFDLKIYPQDISLSVTENEWIVKRKEAQFLWSLLI